jgi:branched-chain amino acid transport system permease protein
MILGQLILSGIVNGAIYSLMAIGYVLIYKGTNVVNFAQGEAVMLGGYISLVYISFLGLSAFVTLPLTFITAMIVWMIVERSVYRSLQDAPVFSLIIATFAVGLCVRNIVRLIFGPDIYNFPPLLSITPIQIKGLYFTLQNIFILIVGFVSTIILYLFFKFTKLGLSLRAISQNRDAALLMGIPVRKYFAFIWGLGSAYGALGGLMLAPLVILHPEMGWIALKAFAVAILGGFESLVGAIVGGLILGVVENLAGYFISSHIKDVISFVIMVLILYIKPSGIFGEVTINRA